MTPSPRRATLAGAAAVALVGAVALVLQFLTPDLAYQVWNRAGEYTSGRANRTYRIGLGFATGSTYHLGEVLNKYLKARAGYELDLVDTSGGADLSTMLTQPSSNLDLAAISGTSNESVRAGNIVALAAVETQYLFVIVPNESPVSEIRDLSGPLNPGNRDPGQPPTLGEDVLAYYGLLASPATPAGRPPAVTIVRPDQNINKDFESGHNVAAMRSQYLHAELIDGLLRNGRYRLVPVRDHVALSRVIPGTQPGFIPAGTYGPSRTIPPDPVPTLVTTSLIVARRDLPARIVRDILDAVYDPRFGRDIQFDLTEEFGRNVGDVPLHPAADIYYHRNDLVTSDRLGRISFVASAIGVLIAGSQFVVRFRREEARKARRRLLASELKRLERLRQQIEASSDDATARTLMTEADDLLASAEQDSAAERLDAEGVQSLRSLHQVCARTLHDRTRRLVSRQEPA